MKFLYLWSGNSCDELRLFLWKRQCCDFMSFYSHLIALEKLLAPLSIFLIKNSNAFKK